MERVRIPVDSVTLEGELAIPRGAPGVVVFAHGSGSGRRSPRNRYVAELMRQAGLGTLLFDLLTEAEGSVDDQTRHLRFDVELLASRLAGASAWTYRQSAARGRPLGYFGASTGAAAALVAAARSPEHVGAVVSRGGRPDLAGPLLHEVRAPTLLIVGGLDTVVQELNEDAYAALRCERQLVIIPGATHLFEEPGTLDRVAELAAGWFEQYLGRAAEAAQAESR